MVAKDASLQYASSGADPGCFNGGGALLEGRKIVEVTNYRGSGM